MWFGCEQPFLFFFFWGGGEGRCVTSQKTVAVETNKSYFDLNHWHKDGLDTGNAVQPLLKRVTSGKWIVAS